MSEPQLVTAQPSDRRSWVVELRRPPERTIALGPHTATASELMFFWDAPLAHVVQYEEELRLARRRSEAQRAVRSAARPAIKLRAHLGESAIGHSRAVKNDL